MKLSVNIGLSSYKSAHLKQGRLLQREAELVTAHEFGHNWGSEHDPQDSPCSPESGPGGGNFLMYAYSNQGHDRNNDVILEAYILHMLTNNSYFKKGLFGVQCEFN